MPKDANGYYIPQYKLDEEEAKKKREPKDPGQATKEAEEQASALEEAGTKPKDMTTKSDPEETKYQDALAKVPGQMGQARFTEEARRSYFKNNPGKPLPRYLSGETTETQIPNKMGTERYYDSQSKQWRTRPIVVKPK
jgi:hypothetical protein